MGTLPVLTGSEETRATLSWYAKAVGAIPRALAELHPKWWHVSLKVEAAGFRTTPLPPAREGQRNFSLFMDQEAHVLKLEADQEASFQIPFTDGLSAREFGRHLI